MSDRPPVSFSAKARRTREAPISALIATVIANPGLISFAAGLVDPLTLPVDECLQITQTIFSDPERAQATLQYDTTIGLTALRAELLQHLARLEDTTPEALKLTPDDLLITTGSQQMLYLVADVLLDPGDIVICGNPTYFVFAGTLESLGARVLTVPMDPDGMETDALDQLLDSLRQSGQLHRVKFIYCTSFFDNPTGLSLSLPRRRRLLEIVEKHSTDHRILVVEDAAYRELRYDGESQPSIKSFDRDNRFVILTQTFSKPFAPGIKLGYTALPREVHEAVLHQKGSHDFGSANISQQIALEAIRAGIYRRHVQRLQREYRRKRDLMLASLQQHLPPGSGITWTRPAGGLYVWITLPPSISTSRQGPLFGDCIRRGVIYVPGEYCFIPDEHGHVPTHHMRLSFGQVDPSQINDGVARLGAAIADQLAPSSAGVSH